MNINVANKLAFNVKQTCRTHFPQQFKNHSDAEIVFSALILGKRNPEAAKTALIEGLSSWG